MVSIKSSFFSLLEKFILPRRVFNIKKVKYSVSEGVKAPDVKGIEYIF